MYAYINRSLPENYGFKNYTNKLRVVCVKSQLLTGLILIVWLTSTFTKRQSNDENTINDYYDLILLIDSVCLEWADNAF